MMNILGRSFLICFPKISSTIVLLGMLFWAVIGWFKATDTLQDLV